MESKKMLMAIAAVIIVGAGAFFGGTVYEKDKLSSQGLLRSSANGQMGQGGQRRGSGQGGQGMGMNRGGGASGGGDFFSGEVISKDDKSVTVKANDGSSKIVYFFDSTAVGKSVQGSSADLAAGEQVMVSGKSNPDGSLAAQNIQIRPVSP